MWDWWWIGVVDEWQEHTASVLIHIQGGAEERLDVAHSHLALDHVATVLDVLGALLLQESNNAFGNSEGRGNQVQNGGWGPPFS
jgi:hypothetical protein